MGVGEDVHVDADDNFGMRFELGGWRYATRRAPETYLTYNTYTIHTLHAHTCTHTCTQAYIHAHTHAHIHTSTHTLRTDIHYIHKYIQPFRHTSIHRVDGTYRNPHPPAREHVSQRSSFVCASQQWLCLASHLLSRCHATW